MRIYGSQKRAPIPRNKYGIINNNTVGDGTSVFGGTTGLNSNTLEGAAVISLDMIDLDSFRGATALEDGERGIVPAPLAGMQDWFLKGDGNWTRIPAYEWLHEFPASEGLEKSGLEIDGNFNVTDTLTTMNLEVQGAAHFWSLIIDEVKAQGGQVLVSPSMFHVDYVGEVVQYNIFDSESPLIQLVTARTDIYNILRANNVEYIRCRRLYQRNDDGERMIENECMVGDMMRCRSFNIKAGEYRNVSNTDYWSFVCNEGEGEYTDEDGNTYTAFWIDLAFTLRKPDGHNYPLGTTLYLDGTYEYPEGYTEITDALELKKTSQEMWDGTRDVEAEFFENSEWTDIQEKVIDIRGLDDQVVDLTGRSANNRLSDRDSFLTQTEENFDIFMNGPSVTTTSAENYAQLIVNGQTSDTQSVGTRNANTNNLAIDLSDSIINNRTVTLDKGSLTIIKKKKSSLTIEKNTVTERVFIADADLYTNDTKTYAKGETIPSGTTTGGDWKVIDFNNEDEATKTVDNVTTSVTTEEKQIIDTFTPDTPSGVEREIDSFIEEQETYSEKTSWQFGYCGYYPNFRIKKDDSMACLGHLYDSDRQNAIVLSSTNPIDPELEAPAIAQYSHIDTFGVSISKYRQTAIAANGNEFMGQFFINYKNTFVDVNERINMFINDIETGLETVGIHLDGENSTIKMVGSIELKQHDQMNGDTLSVYDSLDRKKVEIIPRPIPVKDDPENTIDYTRYSFNNISDKKNANTEFIEYSKEKNWNFWPFTYSWIYTYILKGFNVKFTTSVNLGYLMRYYNLDLSSLNLNLLCNTYLVGNVLVNNHGYGQQGIKSIKYTLKCNGIALQGVTNIDLSSYLDPVGGLNTGNLTASIYGTFLNDYTVPLAGTYTLDIEIVYNVYARHECGTQYNNYYYSIECGISGSVYASITKIQLPDGDMSGSKMTIGTNGLYFSGNNSRYFYAAEDGYELRWDDARIQLDDTHGVRIIPTIKNITASDTDKNIAAKYSVVSCQYGSGGYTVTLPQASVYGSGRELTVLGFPTLTVSCYSGDSINILNISQTSITYSIDDSTPTISMKLMAIGNTWFVISYV